ncbi:P2X purinoceptor 4-like isoform X2 [Paramacrobiotus metropolitanus]|uniref:P2X purinoceptor 4-like isoform X2 n=1 Tax=Paramacrobiotus metropolitanus TaxID=2943436 RepID=UPI002445682C|nr:P2X purinoceptor 4-like isoform X2 [Paramacrobiotus metropolitanus]
MKFVISLVDSGKPDMDKNTCLSFIKRKAKKECRDFFMEYETPKVVKVYDLKLGLINRGLQLAVLGYIIGSIFIINKGYQASEKGEHNTVAKVKGMIKTNTPRQSASNKIWDAADLVIPAVENNALFIATNVIQTPNQRNGRCPESARCSADSHCPAGEPLLLGNGFRTGRCIQGTGTCEIEGWCPAEQDKAPDPPMFMEVANFTILVKNYVVFPKADVRRRNILESHSKEDLASCRYHEKNDPYCPIFGVQYIVEKAGANFVDVASTGGIIAFIIKWECNLDRDVQHCKPQYEFRRMDSKDEKIAKGWSFRNADYWNDPQDGTRKRSLYKFYGIRFVFMVYSEAGKFDAETFALNVGSAVGLLGLTTIVCDFVTLFFMRKKMKTLREKKIDRIRDAGRIPPQAGLNPDDLLKEAYPDIADTALASSDDELTEDGHLPNHEPGELEKLSPKHEQKVLETSL